MNFLFDKPLSFHLISFEYISQVNTNINLPSEESYIIPPNFATPPFVFATITETPEINYEKAEKIEKERIEDFSKGEQKQFVCRFSLVKLV